MASIMGHDAQCTIQERVTRRALFITWMIIAAMPLPFCVWAIPGWIAYAFYFMGVFTGLHPLRTKGLEEKSTFHYLSGGMLIIVACSIAYVPHFVVPFIFVFLTLYLVYWQLEKRLFKIRRSLQEYTYEKLSDNETQELGQGILLIAFKKALLPAAVGTLCCLAGLLPPVICALMLGIVFIVVHLVIKNKQSILTQ